jgi:hypothetical protein
MELKILFFTAQQINVLFIVIQPLWIRHCGQCKFRINFWNYESLCGDGPVATTLPTRQHSTERRRNTSVLLVGMKPTTSEVQQSKTQPLWSVEFTMRFPHHNYTRFSCLPLSVIGPAHWTFHYPNKPNVVVEWLALLFRIQDVPGSNLGP